MTVLSFGMFYVQFEPYLDILCRLLAAVVIGFVIGLERVKNNHDAGLRTHILVCLGAACIMAMSDVMSGQYSLDASRMGAQVVSGIGFLGAGCILMKRDHVHGLTTAAGLWTTSCIGLACGMGYYFIAFTVTILLLIATLALRPLSEHFKGKEIEYRYTIRIRLKKREEFTDIGEYISGQEMYLESMERQEDNVVVLSVMSHSQNTANQLICALMENKKILEVNKIPEIKEANRQSEGRGTRRRSRTRNSGTRSEASSKRIENRQPQINSVDLQADTETTGQQPEVKVSNRQQDAKAVNKQQESKTANKQESKAGNKQQDSKVRNKQQEFKGVGKQQGFKTNGKQAESKTVNSTEKKENG